MTKPDWDKITNSLLSNESSKPEKLTERQEQIIHTTWTALAELYGGSLVNQYGATMPKAWVDALKGVTPRQIADGLNRVTLAGSEYAPNGPQFRNLCLGITTDKNGNDTTHQHAGKAHLEFKDPSHPDYEIYGKPEMIENDDYKTRKRKSGNNHLKNIKGMI